MNCSLELNVLHWNINQKYKDRDTPEMIATEILRKKPDIIVLTEFLKTQNYEDVLVRPLEESEYVVFLDPRDAKEKISQVLIAIRKSIIDNAQSVDEIPICLPDNEGHLFEDNENNAYPNFLRVDFSLGITPVSVIGTRIRIDINQYKRNLPMDEKQERREREHRFRQRQFEHLLREIPSDREIIMLGDFNIDESFVDIKKKNWDYFRHYLPCLNFVELKKFSPDSTAISSPLDSGLRLDHLVLSNDLSAIDVQYFKGECRKKGKNYPDHAILTATIVEAESWVCTKCGRKFPRIGFSDPDICDECATED